MENDEWRNRDVLRQLKRRSGLAASSFHQTPSVSRFDIEPCLARLRHDKANVVRASFSAAALTVVHAVVREEPLLELHNPNHLPKELEEWEHLERIRVNALKRAHDQKDKKASTGAGATTKSPITPSITSSSTTDAVPSTPFQPTPVSVVSSGGSGSGSGGGGAKATTAASSAVLDSRATVSRAVLCSAACMALDELTPGFDADEKLDPLDIPQNSTRHGNDSNNTSSSNVNMGAVLLQAKTLGQRAVEQARNAARRSTDRYRFRKALATPKPQFLDISNPHAWDARNNKMTPNTPVAVVPPLAYEPNPSSQTAAWTSLCLPRLESILQKGSGHAIICDTEWDNRHGRISHLLQSLAEQEENYGPHLIVATQPEVDDYSREYQPMETTVRLVTPPQSPSSSTTPHLRVLSYNGSRAQRRKLRQQYFGDFNGLTDASFHVMVTSYGDLLEDYLHFCQVPFQVVVLDEAFSWLAAAQADQNSEMGTLWGSGVFSNNDQHIGLAGSAIVCKDEWDFGAINPSSKHAYIGLTARHRILTTPTMAMLSQKQKATTLPGLLDFLLPHFSDVIKEEWDRSRIIHDQPSIDHLKKVLTRSIVVHQDKPFKEDNDDNSDEDDMILGRTIASSKTTNLAQLALDAMDGSIGRSVEASGNLGEPPTYVSDEDFVAEGKISQSRRGALSWLSPWLRYELGMAHFTTILSAMKESSTYGHVCEEIIPASSTTSSGAGGTVSGSMAYRLAVRCGRSFGSEQGLRQHMAALHAPPGTWLCRTCGSDCGTSQARTHHERSCGQPKEALNSPNNNSASGGKNSSSIGNRTQHGPVGVVGKKAKGCKSLGQAQDKDDDGSFRVPGYRGVWVNPAGQHFIKIDQKRWEKHGSLVLFETVEQAAREHDKVLKEKPGGLPKGTELNYKSDGSRIVYEDSTAAAAAGRGLEMLGGGSSSVVPALSVINIKDLPKDVKPLLRDPRQTSRTGANSKRHVYAYRGVCRQARKGHDRWQSQISFGGTNHYLGTFDSEWDAAAVYAWAHLILYGEEATKKAQREGEEAAAAYEREKAAIAAGEALPSKPEKTKKKTTKRKAKEDKTDGDIDGTGETSKKKKRVSKDSGGVAGGDKKAKSALKGDAASLAPILAKGVTKVPFLGPRKAFEGISDERLFVEVKNRVAAARMLEYNLSDTSTDQVPVVEPELRPCLPPPLGQSSSTTYSIRGAEALLLGLNPSLFGWIVETFLPTCDFDSATHESKAFEALTEEYESRGHNESFRSVLQGPICILGRANRITERACAKLLGLGSLVTGGTIADIDCHIGGIHDTCAETAASIRLVVAKTSRYVFEALNNQDVVTLNGKRITADMGCFPLYNEDVCTVGARVFVFLQPSEMPIAFPGV